MRTSWEGRRRTSWEVGGGLVGKWEEDEWEDRRKTSWEGRRRTSGKVGGGLVGKWEED